MRRRPTVRRLGVALALTVVAVLGGAATGWALVVAPLSMPDVVRKSALILYGTVTAARAGMDDNGLSCTWVTVSVIRTLKGAAAGAFTFKQFGVPGVAARSGGLDLPRYEVGREVVLFLHGRSRLGFTSPVGFERGLIVIDPNAPAEEPGIVLGQARRLPPAALPGLLTAVETLVGKEH